MSKYLDNTGLSRLITKVKSLIVPPPETVIVARCNTRDNTNQSKYTITATVDKYGSITHKLRSVVITPTYSGGAGPQSIMTFSFSPSPYAGDILDAVESQRLTLLGERANSTSDVSLLVYDITTNRNALSVVVTRNTTLSYGPPNVCEKYYLNQPIVLYLA